MRKEKVNPRMSVSGIQDASDVVSQATKRKGKVGRKRKRNERIV